MVDTFRYHFLYMKSIILNSKSEFFCHFAAFCHIFLHISIVPVYFFTKRIIFQYTINYPVNNRNEKQFSFL